MFLLQKKLKEEGSSSRAATSAMSVAAMSGVVAAGVSAAARGLLRGMYDLFLVMEGEAQLPSKEEK